MLQRVFIANRGEVALRILQACHEMGKECVAGYTQVDSKLMHIGLADDSICIGKQSYLQIDDIITAAKITDCDAIHPGYGFLSENAEFAEKVEANNLVFIGPTPDQIKRLENKATVRQLMSDCGLKVIPGSHANISNLDEALAASEEIGFPLLMKAAFGGGGRGIRLVKDAISIGALWAEAEHEAELNFGRSEIYLEKFLGRARHIEIQLLGDGNGNVIHLGSRDCSIQKRHQKIIEEAPAPGIDSGKLDNLAKDSVSVLSGMDYRSAATLEFLFQDGEFYFLEINARLQVEHPVTEFIADVDIVKAQLSIADTHELPWLQSEIELKGCSIECRINAEDAEFRPSPGTIHKFDPPGGNGVRVDSHIYAGYQVPHHYDSLLAKLIVRGVDRNEALAKMQRALEEFRIEGVETGIPLLKKIVRSQSFIRCEYTTQMLSDDF